MSTKDSTSEVQFIDELPEKAGRRREDPLVAAFAETLKSQPGRWAAHPLNGKWTYRSTCSFASRINNHDTKAPPSLRHGFEATVRNGVAYVRFVGGDE